MIFAKITIIFRTAMIIIVSLCQILECVNLTFEKGDTPHVRCITLSFCIKWIDVEQPL